MRLRDRIEMKKELQLQFHKEFIENYRDSQSKIFQFIGFVVSAIAIFGYAAWSYYYYYPTVTVKGFFYPVDEDVLLVAYILSQIILIVGVALILDVAYTFRRDQLVIAQIRKDWGWNIKEYPEYSELKEKGPVDWIRGFYQILLLGVFFIQITEFKVLRQLTNNSKMIFLPLISFIPFIWYCRKWKRLSKGWDIFSIALGWLLYQMCPKVICELSRRKKIDCDKFFND